MESIALCTNALFEMYSELKVDSGDRFPICLLIKNTFFETTICYFYL